MAKRSNFPTSRASVPPEKMGEDRADPELQRILSERKAAFVEAAVLKMQKTLSESADVLQRIIKNEDVSPQVRVNAIQVLFTQCRNWTETADILKRLEALETEE